MKNDESDEANMDYDNPFEPIEPKTKKLSKVKTSKKKLKSSISSKKLHDSSNEKSKSKKVLLQRDSSSKFREPVLKQKKM